MAGHPQRVVWRRVDTDTVATMSECARRPPTVVQIICTDAVPQHALPEFSTWQVCSTGAATVLIGYGVDQAALHGTLDRLLHLGVHVVELNRYPSA
jgi:hypothetical protein